MSAAAARASLMATLRTVDGVRVALDVGQAVDPPTLVLVPPTLVYEVYHAGPSAATFQVPLVVHSDDRSIEMLERLLPLVEQAIYDSADAALTGASPGNWGTPPLPCYLLTIEVAV
jgi:hypothetical protein